MTWTRERWSEIESLFHAAVQRPHGTRAAFLADACGADVVLRGAVDRLLGADAEGSDDLLDHGAIDLLRGKDPLLGARFGAFRLVERIADGGMGSVYRAARVDGDFQQDVAVKVLRLGRVDAQLHERFARERQTLARLVHQNVARLLDGGTNEHGVPFFAMELIDGLPLDRHCDEAAAPIRARLALFATICRAVHFAHQNLVVHLDLKPSNILVDQHGVPKLLDFGVAALLESVIESSGAPIRNHPLTPEYASPEHARGEPPSTASDVYSLGVVLHELLTGVRPLPPQGAPSKRAADSDAAGEARAKARGTSARQLAKALRGDLDCLVGRCLAADPAARYASCQELVDDVDRHLRGLPIVARESNLGYRVAKFVARNRIAVGAALALAIALLGGIASTWHMATVARRERDAADAARVRIEQEMGHARIEATSSRIVTTFLGDSLLSTEFVSDPAMRDRVRTTMVTRAAQVRRQHAEQPHLRANLLDALGRACAQVDAFPEAEVLLEEAAGIRTEHMGAESLEYALSLASLGRLRYQQGRFPEARRLLADCYRLHKACAPDVHTDVAAAANDLAAAERACGDRARALELHREALRLRREGSADPVLVAESLNNLANSEPESAVRRSHLMEALEIRARILGEDDPLTIQARVNLGRLAIADSDFTAARPLLTDAVASCRRINALGMDALGPALSSLAYVELRLGDLATAAAAIDEALRLDRARLGDSHPRVAMDLEVQANVLERRDGAPAAVTAWQEALRIRKAKLPAGHRDILNTLCSLGGALWRAGRADDAIAPLTEAIALYSATPETATVAMADTHALLGTALEAVGRHEDAERSLLAALGLDPRRPSIRKLLREFYERRSRPADAARYQDEANTAKE